MQPPKAPRGLFSQIPNLNSENKKGRKRNNSSRTQNLCTTFTFLGETQFSASSRKSFFSSKDRQRNPRHNRAAQVSHKRFTVPRWQLLIASLKSLPRKLGRQNFQARLLRSIADESGVNDVSERDGLGSEADARPYSVKCACSH